MTDSLLISTAGAVRTLTLNRPEKRNAIDFALLEALLKALAAAATDEKVRVMVLAGAGPSLCAGADIGQMVERSAHQWERIVDRYLDPVRAIARLDKPVVARCHGNVFGGGLGIAMACDFRIAAESARFCAPFVKLGLAGCDMSAGYFLPRLVGMGRATELMMTGRPIDAAEAQAIGLVTRTVPDAHLDEAVSLLAGELAAGPPRTLAYTKRAIRRSVDSDMQTEFDFETFVQVQCLQSEDHREGVTAFKENRAAVFRGC